MFRINGCAPRGIARDRRQQTGRALSDVRGGVDHVAKSEILGLRCKETDRELYTRMVVTFGFHPSRPEGEGIKEWTRVPSMPVTYEVVCTLRMFADLLVKWSFNVLSYDNVTHRAHGPGLQQSKPYHRR